jgi:hypothetical protein
MLEVVEIIRAIFSIAVCRGMNPRSYADCALRIEREMFVGDVRSATTSLGMT